MKTIFTYYPESPQEKEEFIKFMCNKKHPNYQLISDIIETYELGRHPLLVAFSTLSSISLDFPKRNQIINQIYFLISDFILASHQEYNELWKRFKEIMIEYVISLKKERIDQVKKIVDAYTKPSFQYISPIMQSYCFAGFMSEKI